LEKKEFSDPPDPVNPVEICPLDLTRVSSADDGPARETQQNMTILLASTLLSYKMPRLPE
jgi:hypothetical protein